MISDAGATTVGRRRATGQGEISAVAVTSRESGRLGSKLAYFDSRERRKRHTCVNLKPDEELRSQRFKPCRVKPGTGDVVLRRGES